MRTRRDRGYRGDPIENAEDAANGVKKATISVEEAAEDAANAAKKKAENVNAVKKKAAETVSQDGIR